MRVRDFLRHSRHLWFVLLLVVSVATTFFVVRSRLVPASYGEIGPYRTAALADIAAQPSRWISDAACLECHVSVGEERSGSLHEAVACFHCHGRGAEHVALARQAAESPDIAIPPPAAWDGDPFTKVDLFLTKDKAVCLSCHQDAVGMPADFKKIQVAAHLEEQGASEPDSLEVCFECHAGHNTAP